MAEVTLHQALSADDVSFATARYPALAAAAQVGSISGKVAFSTGSAVVGALVVAVNPASGTTIGGLASMSDGTYQLDAVPLGSYLVYAQPANGPVTRTNLSGVPNANLAKTNFRVTFAGGNAAPSAVTVTAGQASAADISVDPAAPGMQVALIGTGPAGGTAWANFVGPKASAAGLALDLLLWGNGLDSTIAADRIRLIGPGITMRAATLHTSNAVSQPFTTALRFTVDLAPATGAIPVTIAVVKGTDAAVYTGGFVIVGGAAGCSYTLSSKQFSLPAAGGQGTVTVTAGDGCGWTAASSASWLKITSTTAVAGNGSVWFAADPNASAVVRSVGPTIPATGAGAVVIGAPPVAILPTVTVGGTPVTMIGAALSPGSAGLYQIAVQLPTSLPSGMAAIRASVGRASRRLRE